MSTISLLVLPVLFSVSAASADRAICDAAAAERALAAAVRASRGVASDESKSSDHVEKKVQGDRRGAADRKCVDREAGR